MQNTTPIARVPKDYDPMKIAEVKNPFDEDFTHSYDGQPITIPAGKVLQAPEPIARLMAEHIARKQVRMEHEQLREVKKKELGENSENFAKFDRSAIVLFEQKVEEKIAKIMTVTDSIKEVKIMDRVKVNSDKFPINKKKKLAPAPE